METTETVQGSLIILQCTWAVGLAAAYAVPAAWLCLPGYQGELQPAALQ